MITTIHTQSNLRGEQRTQINKVLNQGIDKLRASWNIKIDHVNKNGEIVVRNGGDANQVIDYLSSHPAIKKYITFELY